MNVLVVGSSGFIGSHIVSYLEGQGCQVFSLSSSTSTVSPSCFGSYPLPKIDYSDGYSGFVELLSSIIPSSFPCYGFFDSVIFSAGLAHNEVDSVNSVFRQYFYNAYCPVSFALACDRLGVKKFIFLSSIGVCGDSSHGTKSLTESTPAAPSKHYSFAKYFAEKALLELHSELDIDVLIFRFPLVYGSYPVGNIHLLVKLIRLGLPLPFSLVDNRRSYLSISNLCAFILSALHKPEIFGQFLHLSDGEDLSTAHLCRLVALGIGRPCLLFPFPVILLKSFFFLIGKQPLARSLLNDLKVDSSLARSSLGIAPSGITPSDFYGLRFTR